MDAITVAVPATPTKGSWKTAAESIKDSLFAVDGWLTRPKSKVAHRKGCQHFVDTEWDSYGWKPLDALTEVTHKPCTECAFRVEGLVVQHEQAVEVEPEAEVSEPAETEEVVAVEPKKAPRKRAPRKPKA